jgi:hypothetical protein
MCSKYVPIFSLHKGHSELSKAQILLKHTLHFMGSLVVFLEASPLVHSSLSIALLMH